MTKLQEFKDQLKEVDRNIEELEQLREYIFHRIDELEGELNGTYTG
jgi:chromosome segregation ATPase